jgi:rhodanese-related sulfurtransferase
VAHFQGVSALEITVQDAAERRELRLLDVRPREERWCGLGVIPGSVSPRGDLASEVRGHVELGVPVGLCCMSGRRSLELAQQLGEPSVVSVGGGLLGWQGAGLPVVGGDDGVAAVAQSQAAPPALGALKRALVSCFVAEVVETSAGAVDPMHLLDECFSLVGVDPEQPNIGELLQVVEWAAARSRELGNGYDRIAGNMSDFLAQMQSLVAPG